MPITGPNSDTDVSSTGRVHAWNPAAPAASRTRRTDGQPGYVLVSAAGQHYAYDTPFLGNPSGASGVF